MTSIGRAIFSRCENLQNVTIPNSVTSIEGAFINCKSLQQVKIPKSVANIGSRTFNGCTNLEKIVVAPSNKFYSSKKGVLFNKFGDTLITLPGKITTYVIPSFVTTIGEYAFLYCENLKSVTIPNSVTSIDRFAFEGCKNLQSITLLAKTPPKIKSYFDSSIPTIYVPAESMEKYKKAEVWEEYSHRIMIYSKTAQ